MIATRKKQHQHSGGFTLMELLMVVAVIGILSGIVAGVMTPVSNLRKRKTLEADLKKLVTAIENYKAKFGFYPPDNPNKFPVQAFHEAEWLTPLYYELTGTVIVNRNFFQALDDPGHQVDSAYAKQILGVSGFVNASANRADVKTFLTDLRPGQQPFGRYGPDFRVLAVNLPGTNTIVPSSSPSGNPINPWRYNSSRPVHNPGKFDLWVSVVIGQQTNTIGNWNK